MGKRLKPASGGCHDTKLDLSTDDPSLGSIKTQMCTQSFAVSHGQQASLGLKACCAARVLGILDWPWEIACLDTLSSEAARDMMLDMDSVICG